MSDIKQDEAFNKAVADAVAKVLEHAIPAAVGAAVMATQPKTRAPDNRERCTECRQLIVACQGKHTQMVVWCRDPEADRWFTGVKVNGVTYISPHAGTPITVPLHSDIASILSAYEQGEKEMMRGKRVEHNSGSLNNFRPAQGFR